MFFFRYSILINAHAQKGDADAAFHVLQEMESHGIAPNAFTYGSLINACAKVGRREGGLRSRIFTVLILLSFTKWGKWWWCTVLLLLLLLRFSIITNAGAL